MNILNKNKISGAIGLSILEKDDKEYFIFYDQHNNSNYCSNYNSKFLDQILENNFINSDTLILVEELVNFDSDNIITIWKNTLHTINFKKFYLKHKNHSNLVAFDIRTILFPVSPFLITNLDNSNFKKEFPELETLKLKKMINSITIYEYFYCFFYFFDLVEKDDILHKNYNSIIGHIKIVKKKIINCFKKLNYKEDIYKHFKKLKALVNIFKIKFVDPDPSMILKIFVDKFDSTFRTQSIMSKNLITTEIEDFDFYTWIDFLEILLDYTIEFYAIIILFCFDKKNNFIHSGLIHSSNIVDLLRNHYNFKSVKDTGIINYTETKNEPFVKNCIAI